MKKKKKKNYLSSTQPCLNPSLSLSRLRFESISLEVAKPGESSGKVPYLAGCHAA